MYFLLKLASRFSSCCTCSCYIPQYLSVCCLLSNTEECYCVLQLALLVFHGNLMGFVAVRAGSSFLPKVLVKNAQVVAPLRSLQPNARQPRTLYAVRNSITSNAIVLSNGCLVYQHFRLGSCILLRVAAFVQCCWPFVAHSNSYVFAPNVVHDLLAC